MQHVDCRKLGWGLSDTGLVGRLEAGTTETFVVVQMMNCSTDGDCEGWDEIRRGDQT